MNTTGQSNLTMKPLAKNTTSPDTTAADTQTHDSGARSLYAGRLDSFRDKTKEQKIQELADREEIRDLVATYAHRVALGLANADLFTDDGAFINRGTPGSPAIEFRGRKEIDAHFLARPGGAGNAMPMIHNNLIAIDGDEATAICSIELRVSENGTSTIASGYYQDRLRREAGRWKFVVRDVTFFHWVPLQQGWATPLEENNP